MSRLRASEDLTQLFHMKFPYRSLADTLLPTWLSGMTQSEQVKQNTEMKVNLEFGKGQLHAENIWNAKRWKTWEDRKRLARY